MQEEAGGKRMLQYRITPGARQCKLDELLEQEGLGREGTRLSKMIGTQMLCSIVPVAMAMRMVMVRIWVTFLTAGTWPHVLW
jgi:hypothetical protein